MQRPAASSSGAAAGGAGGTLRVGGTAVVPTSIVKKGNGALDSSTMILEKEEKKDDHHGMMIMKPEGQAGMVVYNGDVASPTNGQTEACCESNAPSSPNNENNAAAKTKFSPLDEVDSALLSALCDSRERKALFRLEQVMIDFMKDKSSGSMEVGGAYNSIVLNQTSGASSNNNGEEDGQTPAISQQGQQELQYQLQRGLRQTSFQRLICHRLADRFNILREQVNHTITSGNERGLVDVGGNANGQQFSPGLIRLVKTNESGIPSHLLIDIDLSVLVNYKNPRAKNYAGGNTNVPVSNNYDDATRNLTENMASATLETPSVATSSSKKPKKKMVIMKRNSSSESGNTDGSGTDKQKGKSRRKKLEDREKAYEEARARIFGISESSGNENNDGGDDNADKGERPSVPQSQDSSENAPTPLNSCHSSFSVEKDVTSAGIGEHIVPSQLISSATPSADHSSPPSPETPRDQEPTSPSVAATEADTSRQPSSSSSASSVPAAATGGAISKAVYRNRQQEENDPDFKRRSDVRSAYVPYVTNNPYGAPVGANPYAAMGQQPPPPQMIAMQMQQQAVHQPHFYHGQQNQFPTPQVHPNQFPTPHGQPNQFPTPQDATYAANMSNNPPPQWVAPQRGFYPPPQQQGQEKHPQAWQPRPTPSQIPPINGSGDHGVNHGAQSNAPPNFVSNSQPQPQIKQPATVLWGPGARGNSKSSDVTQTSSTVEKASTKGEGKAAVYKPEDFPALG